MRTDAGGKRGTTERETLQHITLLSGLDPGLVATIASQCAWQPVDGGRELFGAGVPSADVYFVVTGTVRVTTFSAGGREVSFRDLPAGSTLGTVAAVDGEPRSASAIAVEAALVAILPQERFLALVAAHPKLAIAVLIEFASLIRDLTNRVVATTTATVPDRVRQELLRFAGVAGVKNNKAVLHRLPTHADFATRIGATREAVTREFGKLQRAGLLLRDGKSTVLTDVRRLEEITESDDG